ncbi:helix-turn-helix domain-containing protein [Streptosporangium sp. NPDC020145]|uniref:helix-turn-helix domain-containing protein n=1 Tax=Streptosporangium sp. NPDC020145 TaxID=3154694 RepID=UPI003437BA6D
MPRVRDPHHLRTAMYRAGLDSTALAEKVGVSRQFISLLTKGQRGCSPSTAQALSTALSMPVMFVSTNNNEIEKEGPMTATQLTEEDPYLLFEDVALLARMPIKTLRHYRAIGRGPKFFKRGQRLMIRKSAARRWIEDTFENVSA